MFTNAQAINAAASYVAENTEVFTAAYNENIDKAQGNSARTVREALRTAVGGGRDPYSTVKLAATWLAGNEQHLRNAVQQGVANGTLPRGTTTVQAQRFLNNALGVRPAAAAPVAAVREPVAELRDEFVAALQGQTGQVRITVEGTVEAVSELLGL